MIHTTLPLSVETTVGTPFEGENLRCVSSCPESFSNAWFTLPSSCNIRNFTDTYSKIRHPL